MTAAEKEIWFAKYYPLALATERKYGVPALVTLAQHVWEGGWNNKNKYFNLFGVKADARWKGAKQLQNTWEVHRDKTHKYPKVHSITLRPDGNYLYKVADWFRAYPSLQAAYDDHGLFLKQNPRYRPAFAHKDPESFARAMVAAGYATDPDYLRKLLSIMPEFKKKAAAFTSQSMGQPSPASWQPPTFSPSVESDSTAGAELS